MTGNRDFSIITDRSSIWRRTGQRRGALIAVLLLASLGLNACLSFLPSVTPVRTPVVLPVASGDRPQIALSPSGGYAGVYVQVVGNGWPANGLVLVTLSDDVGRSGILAASAADSDGQVTTGFLYPISPRWLTQGPHTVVAYTADGNLQATADFQVMPGEGVTPVATSQSNAPTATATPLPAPKPTAQPTPGVTATPTPSATATATSAPTPIVITDWRGDYWANSTLSGAPALVRNDTAVFFDWGSGSPAPGLPADQFSARWTRRLDFDAGVYQFFVEVDDGARVFVDDQLVLDEWRAGSQRVASATVPLAAGRHTLRVDYFERTGQALVRFWWERQVSFTGWEGRYYANRNLQGDPAVVRDDAAINFDWGSDGPAPAVGVDNFSVRWQRTVALDAGRYRFYARMDDGLRARIDGQLLVDEWQDGPDRTVATDVDLPGGSYQIEVEYYEHTGGALVSFWWDLAPAPTPTYTSTWTPTPTPTSTPTFVPSSTPTATRAPTQTPTPVLPATATPTATIMLKPSLTATVVTNGGSPTPIAGDIEIGRSVPFTRVVMPPLLPPKVGIYRLIAAQAEWNALLGGLRPPKTARPALRPTSAGRGATPTPTMTPTATATSTATTTWGPLQTPGGLPVSPGQAPVIPNFDEEIVLAVILSVDHAGDSAQIVDVRLDANDLIVKVRIRSQTGRSLLAASGADAVVVRRDLLPPLADLTIHFVDEFYQRIDAAPLDR